ncbi:phage repressor protein [Mameliella alba]|nr:S24 family peptidase [Mameliella alba]OWV40407.1 phage repressor protein [Mameliella alba]
MQQTFIEALQNALDKTGKSVRHISDISGVPYERLRQVARGRTSSTNADDAYRIAQAFGVSYERFMSGDLDDSDTITIAGKVGAGAQVPVFDAYEKGAGPQVAPPPGLPTSGIVAVEVEGDSMEPVYSAGDLLFYSRNSHEGVPAEVIGHRCVVEDAEGMGWVKQVKRGDEPGLFHLISLNPGADTMWNVKLKWAARVRLHWPSDLVRNV